MYPNEAFLKASRHQPHLQVVTSTSKSLNTNIKLHALHVFDLLSSWNPSAQSCILPNKSCRSHLVHYPHAHNAASNPLQRLQMMLSENHRALLDCNFSHPIYAASFAFSSCIRKRIPSYHSSCPRSWPCSQSARCSAALLHAHSGSHKLT